MPNTGIQHSLPFPRHAALASPPDTNFPLAAERLLLRQKVESIQRLLACQGTSLNALHVIVAIKDDQISHMNGYIAALEKEIRRLAEPDTPAAPQPKRRRRTHPAGGGPEDRPHPSQTVA